SRIASKMKKQVLLLIVYALLVIASIWLSLDPDKAIWRKILNEIIAIFFSIRFYETFKELK
ncbi:MAG: hypothetical protein II023_01545, partial [Prevotella sp.]|nr:hypothetical protein [Prevotella sp.]